MQGDIEEKVFEIFRKYLFRDLTQCEDPFSESIFGEKIALLPAEAYFLLVKIKYTQQRLFVIRCTLIILLLIA